MEWPQCEVCMSQRKNVNVGKLLIKKEWYTEATRHGPGLRQANTQGNLTTDWVPRLANIPRITMPLMITNQPNNQPSNF